MIRVLFNTLRRHMPIIPFLILLNLCQLIAYGWDIDVLKLSTKMSDSSDRTYLTSTASPLVLAYLF
ncbi:hypothetical protein [Bacillus cereus]|uniref:hypothetical protein n=1 Tax=Bacillus cereus TaxID=1396 RepID=UPI0039812DDF